MLDIMEYFCGQCSITFPNPRGLFYPNQLAYVYNNNVYNNLNKKEA